jgi:hypothetical protein
MCNHLNLKILVHIFTIIYLTIITIIMRGEDFVAHLDALGGTPVCRGTPVAHHCSRGVVLEIWGVCLNKGEGANACEIRMGLQLMGLHWLAVI